MTKLFLGIAAIVLAVVLNAVTLMLLWDWIVVGTFGVAAITLGQSFGLSVFVSFFKVGLATTEHSKNTKIEYVIAMAFAQVILSNALFIGLGFIASLFI